MKWQQTSRRGGNQRELGGRLSAFHGLVSAIRLSPIRVALSVRRESLTPLHTQGEGQLGPTSPVEEGHRICGHTLKPPQGSYRLFSFEPPLVCLL